MVSSGNKVGQATEETSTPDTQNRAAVGSHTKTPSPSQPTACNYYISSDNDSEPEDETLKREVTQLRERSVS